MRNNNQKVVLCLAKKEYRSDRGRSIVLTGAVAFAVMMLFSVFSFASGKLQTDMLRSARQRGAVSNTTLERATQKQYEQIQELSYIRHTGKYIQFGNVFGNRAAVVDDVAWEKIKSPAFTDIHGTYPEGKMEIMFPVRALEMMGISQPQIGMELPVAIEFSEERQEEFVFRLSGYYTEYIDTSQYGPPDVYFSQAFLDAVSDGEEWDVTLFMRQDDRVTGRQVEQKLYRDIAMQDIKQRFFGNNTSVEVAVFTMVGGFDTLFMITVVILLSAGLLIYNVQYIFYERRIREYGLLKTLGTTRKQLCAIVFWQTAVTILRGSLLGMLAGGMLVLLVLPLLLSRMYLYRIGSAAGMITFRPLFLVLSVLFVSCVAFLCSALSIRHTMNLTPVEAANYQKLEAAYTGKSVYRQKGGGFRLWQMAWRNMWRFRRRFLVSAVCLTLGLLVSLGVVMLSRGVDTANEIESVYWDMWVNSDILNTDYYDISLGSHRKNDDGTITIFPQEFLEKIQALPGIAESAVTRGGFGQVKMNEEALALFMRDYEWPWWIDWATFVTAELSGEQLAEGRNLQ